MNRAGQAFLLWLRGMRIQGRVVFGFLNAQVDEYIRRLNLLKDTVNNITGPVLDLASPVVDTARQPWRGPNREQRHRGARLGVVVALTVSWPRYVKTTRQHVERP